MDDIQVPTDFRQFYKICSNEEHARDARIQAVIDAPMDIDDDSFGDLIANMPTVNMHSFHVRQAFERSLDASAVLALYFLSYAFNVSQDEAAKLYAKYPTNFCAILYVLGAGLAITSDARDIIFSLPVDDAMYDAHGLQKEAAVEQAPRERTAKEKAAREEAEKFQAAKREMEAQEEAEKKRVAANNLMLAASANKAKALEAKRVAEQQAAKDQLAADKKQIMKDLRAKRRLVTEENHEADLQAAYDTALSGIEGQVRAAKELQEAQDLEYAKTLVAKTNEWMSSGAEHFEKVLTPESAFEVAVKIFLEEYYDSSVLFDDNDHCLTLRQMRNDYFEWALQQPNFDTHKRPTSGQFNYVIKCCTPDSLIRNTGLRRYRYQRKKVAPAVVPVMEAEKTIDDNNRLYTQFETMSESDEDEELHVTKKSKKSD